MKPDVLCVPFSSADRTSWDAQSGRESIPVRRAWPVLRAALNAKRSANLNVRSTSADVEMLATKSANSMRLDVKFGPQINNASRAPNVKESASVLNLARMATRRHANVAIVEAKSVFVWAVNGQPGRHVAERANLTTNVHATIVDPNCENVCPMASGAHGMNAWEFRPMISCVIPMVSVNVNPMAAVFTSPNKLEI